MATLDPALASAIAAGRSNVIARPQLGDAWGRLGQAFDAADYGPESETCYARAFELEPGSARWVHLLGLRQLREQPAKALSSLERAVQLAGPTNDAPRLRLAQALIERGRFAEATNQLQPLLAVNSAHAAARVEMARALLSLGQPAPAPALLLPCLTNPYTARPAHLLLGNALLRTGDAEGAARHAKIAATLPKPFDWPDPFLREVQALRQDSRRLAEQANSLLLQRRLPEAESALTNLLARTPDDDEGLLILGRIRLQQRRCSDAESLLKQHMAVRPDSINGLVQLGMAHYCQAQFEEAARSFSRAIELKPDFAQAHFNLGLTRSRAGDSQGAIRSLRDALRCNPGEAPTHAALAEELLRTGDADGARTHADRALALEPANARAKSVRERLPK